MHNIAIILVFHGSRNPGSAREAAEFTAAIRDSNRGCHIGHAFLRESSPDIKSAIAAAAATGVKQIRLIPLFALTGTHTSIDIPALMHEAEILYSDISFTLDPVLVKARQFASFISSRIIEE